ncbi:3-hydroxy-3-methylglutaryl-ACP synthase [Candidatus Marinamargulisbacteria bacterium SCGC AG-414-C22]|nr:3-hydroxy-3-methylglutaryl-ACP synthase [Candidatus Marinamargulisbacteria bacterium SCGC AG-414-C22]
MEVGIEAIGTYFGSASLDVKVLAEERKLDIERFYKNLIVKEKTVAMPYEDPVSNAVNAAKPICDKLSDDEKDAIEMVITCTESGIDMAKSLSTYVHLHLNLNKRCRLFEIKNACYAGTAGLQMAVNFVLSQTSPNSKVLVICSDIYRMFDYLQSDIPEAAYYEPNTGAGAIALLISNKPKIMSIDIGASGYYGFETWDSSQPMPDYHFGDTDLSLMSYMDCCENSYKEYCKKVDQVDFRETFQYLAFHTPFVGMVKGAHRSMMRKFTEVKNPLQINDDFDQRVEPGTHYCKRVGNIMGGSLYMALAGVIDFGDFKEPKRIGLFSYGSGCSSEFFSGIVTNQAKETNKKLDIEKKLDNRYKLSFSEYQSLFAYNETNLRMGKNNIQIQKEFIQGAYDVVKGSQSLVLDFIEDNFYRHYKWV